MEGSLHTCVMQDHKTAHPPVAHKNAYLFCKRAALPLIANGVLTYLAKVYKKSSDKKHSNNVPFK